MAHVGSDLGFLSSSEWSNAPAFKPHKLALEVGLEPYSYSTLHLAIEHFLTVMVMGGVFERHPTLRFGAIELGAHWLGPLADSLDMWATKVFARRMQSTISMQPSEYLARDCAGDAAQCRRAGGQIFLPLPAACKLLLLFDRLPTPRRRRAHQRQGLRHAEATGR